MRRPSQRSERGVVATIVALSMVAVVIAAALVVDFGIARLDRQTNKAAADAAATSGMAAAAQNIDQLRPWEGVCSAVSTLKANVRALGSGSPSETWTHGDGTAATNPCNDPIQLKSPCVPDTPSSWAVYRASVGSDLQVEVKSGYKVTDGGFPTESYTSLVNDQGSAAKGGCDQLAVIITQRRKPGLGSLASPNDLTTTVRSVARIEIGEHGKAPVALLVLEQHDCSAINTDGATTKLWVHGSDIIPGLLHSDSLGDTPGNTGGCQSGKIVGGTGQVKAFAAPSGGAPGVVGIRALLPGEAGNVPAAFDPPPAVVAEGQPGSRPEGRPLVTRAPVDERYLAPVTAKVGAVWPMFGWDQAQAEAQGYTWKSPASCNGSGITNTFTDDKVYINCPGGAVFGTTTFTGSSVIINGPVKVKSGETLALPDATRFYIRGATGGAVNDIGLDVDGRLRVHDDSDQPCVNTDSATSGRAEVVVGGGQVNATNSSSLFRMCHTTLITMGNLTGMPAYADPAPAPADNSRNGNLNITGGSQDWTAPNAKPGLPADPADWANFEDLAFWTETSNESRVGGGGSMHLAGVFMLPNANPFTIGGTGSQDVENCQYVARKLHAHGGGTLDMTPDASDVVQVEYFGDVALVR